MIKPTKRLYRKFLKNVKFTKGNCWLWEGVKIGGGYGCFRWKGRRYFAHRLAITLFLDHNYDPAGRGKDGDYATHDCDIKLCVSPHCVRIGTPASNIHEAFARNRIDTAKISKAMMGNQYALGNRGWLGRKHSEKSKRRMSESQRGNQNALGHSHKHSEESKRKISETMMGHKFSEEHNRKIGEANRRRVWSEESRKKLSESRRKLFERRLS